MKTLKDALEFAESGESTGGEASHAALAILAKEVRKLHSAIEQTIGYCESTNGEEEGIRLLRDVLQERLEPQGPRPFLPDQLHVEHGSARPLVVTGAFGSEKVAFSLTLHHGLCLQSSLSDGCARIEARRSKA